LIPSYKIILKDISNDIICKITISTVKTVVLLDIHMTQGFEPASGGFGGEKFEDF